MYTIVAHNGAIYQERKILAHLLGMITFIGVVFAVVYLGLHIIASLDTGTINNQYQEKSALSSEDPIMVTDIRN